jgi:hypothetical protein
MPLVQVGLIKGILSAALDPLGDKRSDATYGVVVVVLTAYLVVKTVLLGVCLLANSWEWKVDKLEGKGIKNLAKASGKDDVFSINSEENSISDIDFVNQLTKSAIHALVQLIKISFMLDSTILLHTYLKINMYSIATMTTHLKLLASLNLIILIANLYIFSILSTPFGFIDRCGIFDRSNPLLYLRSLGVLFQACCWVVEIRSGTLDSLDTVQDIGQLVIALVMILSQIRRLGFAECKEIRLSILTVLSFTMVVSLFAIFHRAKLWTSGKSLDLVVILTSPMVAIVVNSLYTSRLTILLTRNHGESSDKQINLLYLRLFYRNYCNLPNDSSASRLLKTLPLQVCCHRAHCNHRHCMCRLSIINAPASTTSQMVESVTKVVDDKLQVHNRPHLLLGDFDPTLLLRRDKITRLEILNTILEAEKKPRLSRTLTSSTSDVENYPEYSVYSSKRRMDLMLWSMFHLYLSSIRDRSRSFNIEMSFASFLLHNNQYPQSAQSRLLRKYKVALGSSSQLSYINRTIIQNYIDICRQSLEKSLEPQSLQSKLNQSKVRSSLSLFEVSDYVKEAKDNSLLAVLDYQKALAEFLPKIRYIGNLKVQYYLSLLHGPIDYPSLLDQAQVISKEVEVAESTLHSLTTHNRMSIQLLTSICLFEQVVREHRYLQRKYRVMLREMKYMRGVGGDDQKDGNARTGRAKDAGSEERDAKNGKGQDDKLDLFCEENAVLFIRMENGRARIKLASGNAKKVLGLPEIEEIIGTDLSPLIAEFVCPNHNELLINYLSGISAREGGDRRICTASRVVGRGSQSDFTLNPVWVLPQIEIRLSGGVHIGGLIRHRGKDRMRLYATKNGRIFSCSKDV